MPASKFALDVHKHVWPLLVKQRWLSLGELWAVQDCSQAVWEIIESVGGCPRAFHHICSANLTTAQRDAVLDIVCAPLQRIIVGDEPPELIESARTGLAEIYKCEDFISRLGGHAISLSSSCAGLVLQCASLNYVKSCDSNSWHYFVFLEQNGKFQLVCGAVRSGSTPAFGFMSGESREAGPENDRQLRRELLASTSCGCTCNHALLKQFLTLGDKAGRCDLKLEELKWDYSNRLEITNGWRLARREEVANRLGEVLQLMNKSDENRFARSKVIAAALADDHKITREGLVEPRGSLDHNRLNPPSDPKRFARMLRRMRASEASGEDEEANSPSPPLPVPELTHMVVTKNIVWTAFEDLFQQLLGGADSYLALDASNHLSSEPLTLTRELKNIGRYFHWIQPNSNVDPHTQRWTEGREVPAPNVDFAVWAAVAAVQRKVGEDDLYAISELRSQWAVSTSWSRAIESDQYPLPGLPTESYFQVRQSLVELLQNAVVGEVTWHRDACSADGWGRACLRVRLPQSKSALELLCDMFPWHDYPEPMSACTLDWDAPDEPDIGFSRIFSLHGYLNTRNLNWTAWKRLESRLPPLQSLPTCAALDALMSAVLVLGRQRVIDPSRSMWQEPARNDFEVSQADIDSLRSLDPLLRNRYKDHKDNRLIHDTPPALAISLALRHHMLACPLRVFLDALPDDELELEENEDSRGYTMLFPSGLVDTPPEWLQPRVDLEALLACVKRFGHGDLQERFLGCADNSRSEGREFCDAVGIVKIEGGYVYPQWRSRRPLDIQPDPNYDGPIDSMSFDAISLATDDAVSMWRGGVLLRCPQHLARELS